MNQPWGRERGSRPAQMRTTRRLRSEVRPGEPRWACQLTRMAEGLRTDARPPRCWPATAECRWQTQRPDGHEAEGVRSAVTNHEAPGEDPSQPPSLSANLARRRNLRKVASFNEDPVALPTARFCGHCWCRGRTRDGRTAGRTTPRRRARSSEGNPPSSPQSGLT